MFDIEMVEWTEELAVDIPEIDSQHRELFLRLNSLIEAVNAGKGPEEVGKVIDFLETYVDIHFSTEERLMSETLYPGYQYHKNQHRVFVNSLALLKEKYEVRGVTAVLLELLQSQLCGWIVTHVMKSDKKFGSFLADQSKEV